MPPGQPTSMVTPLPAGSSPWVNVAPSAVLVRLRQLVLDPGEAIIGGIVLGFVTGFDPIFLAGAIAVLLLGFDVVPPGRVGLTFVVWVTLALVALTFSTEFLWGRYVDEGRMRGR